MTIYITHTIPSRKMPPKKRTPAAPPKKKTVKLAQNLALSTDEEKEVRQAFEYFTDPEELGKDVIQTKDLRKAFSGLGFDLSAAETRDIKETIDPDDEGIITYDLFLEVAAMKMKGMLVLDHPVDTHGKLTILIEEPRPG
ncbi:hypothetical protein AA313_de0208188 [Arthrobotrys entomopaga]|nr:hypothetical protein AA313_de0208188 [Arthrobotrys entomopaga]